MHLGLISLEGAGCRPSPPRDVTRRSRRPSGSAGSRQVAAPCQKAEKERPAMFHISRQIYRELAQDIADEDDRETVLHACEDAVQRLVNDRYYFAPAPRAPSNELRRVC